MSFAVIFLNHCMFFTLTQVAVSPSPKALSWFCCQPESSSVFPQFFLSRDCESKDVKSLPLVNGTRGIFGVGAALYCRHLSSSHASEWASFKRFLLHFCSWMFFLVV